MKNGFIDYSDSAVVNFERDCPLFLKAVQILIEETAKRGCSLSENSDCEKKITFQKDSSLASEAFEIFIDKNECRIFAAEGRGAIYAAGRLLRTAKWKENNFILPNNSHIIEAPHSKIRGHQLGYRPKTNAYDAWTPEIFEQYIRELALFGANSVEIMPPVTDDDRSSPLMKLDSLEMMVTLSKIIKSYGMEVWVWYPNMFAENANENELAAQERERDEVFAAVPFVDHIFIPGGDPGSLKPARLFEWGKRVFEIARRHHENVKLWLSPQTGTPGAEWVEEFYSQLEKQPEWLCGVVFAPWERDNIDTLRLRTPEHFLLRNYPDISHSLRCQYPVANWNLPMALTLGREFVNPRPRAMQNIHALYSHYSSGSVCYSEGINDDANKFIWLALEWNPQADCSQILLEYSSLFINGNVAEDFARGLFELEENLKGSFEAAGTKNTFELFCAMESENPALKNNYRFNLHLLRACFDMFQRERLPLERSAERKALELLKNYEHEGAEKCAEAALALLNNPAQSSLIIKLKNKIFELSDLLFEQIGAQLTVSRNGASAWDRGAFVECLNIPLNDSRYINSVLSQVFSLPSEREKAGLIAALLCRTDPGEGGFYINFGSAESFALLEGYEGYAADPGFFKTPLLSFLLQPPHGGQDKTNAPLSWQSNISTLYQTPLFVNIEGLDPGADYEITTVYAKYHPIHISLFAENGGSILIHGEVFVNSPFVCKTVPLPKASYSGGSLRLKFMVRDGERGPNVSEITIKRLPF